MPVAREPLPIDAHLDRIVALVREHRAVVVTAAPGAGKTTRVPPALVEDGRVLLLQPRRVAARAIARRIAEERGWTVGREVGWHMRFDRQFTAETRLIVATEGILTARLQQDPLLDEFRTIVLDEFHERSIHADLGIALGKQAWLARRDLRLVVMSATIDARRIAPYLANCPITEIPGRAYPVDVSYRPGARLESVVADVVATTRGAVLCFLAGAPEIRAAAERVRARVGPGIPVLPLHGSLDADEQDAALRPSSQPRVILATNLAETTVTVPDVTSVIDTGWQKVARFDPARGIDSLDQERISEDSADQRTGRAGRTGPGVAIRLWDARDRLRPHREPEIARVDLAAAALSVLAWGGHPGTIDWLDAPPVPAIDSAMTLLRRLGAIDDRSRLTETGRLLQRLPVHPRLGRMLIASRGAPAIALACALLSERHFTPPRHETTSCDLLAVLDRPEWLPPHVPRVAREIRSSVRAATGGPLAEAIDDEGFRRAVLAGYPDRVARRRTPLQDRLLLASGTGARLARESGVQAEYLVAVDVAAGRGAPGAEALVRMATGIEREWLTPTARELRHEIDTEGRVRAARLDKYDAIVLAEHPVPPDPAAAAALVADERIRRGPTDADTQLLARLAFAGVPAEFDALVRASAQGATRVDEVRLDAGVAADARRRADRDAPALWRLPGGRAARLVYTDDGRVTAAVRLQDLFGVTDSPRIGPGRVAVTFQLLAPNGRPVQVTSDLRSFWASAYPALRPALRARYPKHKW
jgi:ATP-dependent helicase HrpB